MAVIKEIKDAIVKEFNPSGDALFSMIQCGSFFGLVLSPEVAVLMDETEEKLYLTHPKMVEDYQNPLVLVSVLKNRIETLEFVGSENHPAIMKLVEMIKGKKWLN